MSIPVARYGRDERVVVWSMTAEQLAAMRADWREETTVSVLGTPEVRVSYALRPVGSRLDVYLDASVLENDALDRFARAGTDVLFLLTVGILTREAEKHAGSSRGFAARLASSALRA